MYYLMQEHHVPQKARPVLSIFHNSRLPFVEYIGVVSALAVNSPIDDLAESVAAALAPRCLHKEKGKVSTTLTTV